MTEEAATSETTPGRNWGRIIYRAITRPLYVALFLAGLLVAGIVLLNSPIGHRWIAERIAAYAPASGLRIEVGRIEGSIYGEMILHDVRFSDPKGRFADVPVTELDWRPLHWFTSGLDVRKLVFHRGTLQRFPEPEPGDPDAPILPNFDIRVDRLEFDRLRLAEDVIGEARIINFKARADIRSGRALVEAQGDLGGTDRLALRIDAEPDDDIFDIGLNYAAPKGGVLATMVGAQEDLHAVIAGDGSWTKWDGALLVQQGEEERLAALRLTNRSGEYGILGQVRPNGYVSGPVANALGEVVSVRASGTLEESVVDGQLALAASGFRMNGAGAVDLANNAFDQFGIKARVTRPDAFGPSLRLEGTSLTAELDGPFRELTVRHALGIDRLTAGETRLAGVRQQGVLTREGQTWTLPLAVRVGRVASGVELLDPRLVDGRLDGSVRLVGDRLLSDDLRIAFEGLGAQISLRGDVKRGGYAIAGPVNVSNLALQDLGSVSGQAKIVASFGDNSPWLVRANFAGRMPRVDNATLTSVAGTNIRFRGGVAVGGARPLLFNNTVLTASKLTLNLDGRLANGKTYLAGNGSHVDYGGFTFNAEVADDGPRAELLFANPLPAAGMRDVRLAIAPIEQGFGIETEGQSTLGPFNGDLRFYSLPGEPSRIAVDRLRVYETDVQGELALVEGGVDGSLTLDGGGLKGSIVLAPRGAGQGFTADVAASNATFGGTTPLSIARGSVQMSGVLATGQTTINGTLDMQGLRYGSLFLGRAAAEARLANGRGEFNASIAGRRGSRFAMQIQGDVAPDRAAVVARGELAGRSITMPRRAIFVRREDNGWILRPTQVSFADGAMIAEARFGGDEPMAGRLQMNRMPLSITDLAMGELGLGGTISGNIRLSADASGLPVGEAKVIVNRLSRSGLTLTSRPIDMALVARLDADDLQARAVLDEGDAERGRLQARISNLSPTGTLMERISAGQLFAQMRYSGPADALWRLSRVEVFDITGDLKLAADAVGSLNSPRIRGSLSGDSLRVSSSLTGTDINEVVVRGRFEGSRLALTKLTGTATNGGTVVGSGTVDLSGLGQGLPRADIRLAARNARILNRSDMAATVTGPLRIITNRQRGTIAGRLTINEASWTLGNATAAEQLPNIRTTEINLPPDIAPPDVVGRPWRYLIDARADDNVDVRGLGLDSEWRADVRLRGTTADPRIGGEANLVEGDYRFAGTQFELVRGRIVFSEDSPPDPQLDILAETTQNSLTARVAVTGTSLQPEIRLSSIPALPEEEILARLLYGGSITTLSATDALQLGAALASLRGGGGLDPINELRTAIGLDRLRIEAPDPALDRETAIALGKNITNRFYVEIITDGQGYSATELEFRVTSWLSLLASISTVGRESLSLEYSRDY